MTHGILVTVPMPIERYRAVNAAIAEELGDRAPSGLLVHIARELPDGFQVMEVWESRKHCDDFQDTVLAPIIERVSGGQAPRREDVTDHFEVEDYFVTPEAAAASTN